MQNKLIIGIGNEAKGDDGLGWAFLDSILKKYPEYKFQYNYQLGPEDAEVISHYNWVLIVDASYNHFDKGYHLSELKPSENIEAVTHSMKPEQLLYLSEQFFGRKPELWLLEICGAAFEIGTNLSQGALHNLHRSEIAFQDMNRVET